MLMSTSVSPSRMTKSEIAEALGAKAPRQCIGATHVLHDGSKTSKTGKSLVVGAGLYNAVWLSLAAAPSLQRDISR
jgi:hypothetical protein